MSSATGPVIEVVGLRKSYGSRPAIDGIDLSVERGELVAILGPNGAGKTTTVEILEGLRHRDAGAVRVLDHDPQTASSADRARIGVVLQEMGTEPFLTVRESIELYRGWYPAPLSTAETMELCSLSEIADLRASSLSGGQRRRLDVATAIVGDPEVLFLDEPTTGFDPQARRASWEMIRGFREAGTTVVLTTHYLDEAQFLADRVVVIAGGRVVAEGPPESVAGEAGATSIAARVPAGPPLPASLGASVIGDRFEIVTESPTVTLRVLTVWASRHGIELDDLTVSRPNLEERYLRLIQEQER